MDEPLTIIDFKSGLHITGWEVVNDAVMGGRSSGNFHKSEKGHGVFQGSVSLANNGGFSLVRFTLLSKISTVGKNKFILYLKGDGKRYQFRVKTDKNDRHSYVTYFNTTSKWQTLTIPFEQLYPAYRGRKLDEPGFTGETIEEAGFLVGNKKEEDFTLLIDRITLA